MASDGPETVLVDPIAWTADASERRTPGSERATTTAALIALWSIERASRLGPSVGGLPTTSLMLGSSISNGGGGGGKGERGWDGDAGGASKLLPQPLLDDIRPI